MPTPPPYRARTLTLAGLTLSLLCGFAPVVRAQDTVPTDKTATFGHSMLGDAFNDVPRQRAYLMKGMPNVHFPITTKNALAQRFFDQGIGQMHGYWYLEAAALVSQGGGTRPGLSDGLLGIGACGH